MAWIELGRCTGTLWPTSAHMYDALEEIAGCPAEYTANTNYEESDRVSSNGLVYQCKSFPLSRHCSQSGYEPNTNPGKKLKMLHLHADQLILTVCKSFLTFDLSCSHPATPGAWKHACSRLLFRNSDSHNQSNL